MIKREEEQQEVNYDDDADDADDDNDDDEDGDDNFLPHKSQSAVSIAMTVFCQAVC